MMSYRARLAASLRPRAAHSLVIGALLSVAVAPAASAQGGLSSLGFGYPVGSVSTRAAATGGSFAEFDALSPVNPASLGGIARTVLTVQAEPEFRTVRLGSSREKSTVQRLPLLNVVFPTVRGVAVGVSAATFLDRSYTTVTNDVIVIDGTNVDTRDSIDVRGSIGDLRLAAGWRINDRFSIGLGGHLFTGDNLVARERTFADTSLFGNVIDSSRVVYFGTAISLGGEWRVRKGLAAQVSYRKGGDMDARVLDTVRTRATIPDRVGLGIRFDGIPGSIFAFGVDRQSWSSLKTLGSDLVKPRDATNWHLGAEVAGPRIRGSSLMVRAGYARHALPFGLEGGVVNESRFTTGVGLPVAREQASIDLSLQRANRSVVGGSAKESAWLLGVGVQIRP